MGNNFETPPWVRDYLGIPFKAQGRTRGGLDCWGLITLVYLEQFYIELPDYLDHYDAESPPAQLKWLFFSGLQEPVWSPVEPADVEAGTMVLLRIFGQPSHCGVMIGPGEMLHSWKGSDSCVSPIGGTRWRHNLAGFVKYSGG